MTGYPVDLTVDGFRADFDGTTSSDRGTLQRRPDLCRDGLPFGGTPPRCRVLSLMANGYVDLGTYVRVTPYVGCGRRLQLHLMGDGSRQHQIIASTASVSVRLPAEAGLQRRIMGGEKDWRFTYAFNGGRRLRPYPGI